MLHNGILSATRVVYLKDLYQVRFCFLFILTIFVLCAYTTPISLADDTNLFCCGNDLGVMEMK